MSKDTQDIVIDKEVTDAIASVVSKDTDAKITALKKLIEERMPAVEEKVVDKGARGGADANEDIAVEKMGKEQFAAEQLKYLVQGNRTKLAELNNVAYKSQFEAGIINKATYQNATTNADGGFLVPNAELYNDVMDVLPEYSVLAGELLTITLQAGDSLDVSTLVGDAVVTEVGSEGGTKDDTKLTFGQKTITVREFAGIVGFTKQWVRQSSFDVYAIIRNSIARAIAKKREQLILTDSTSGIVVTSGVVERQLAATKTSYEDVTWADIKAMPYLVPTSSANGGMYVISRLLLGHLDSLEDTTGQPIVTVDGTANGGALTGRFKNGYRFVVAETLGAADAADTAFAVFGNFSKYGVLLRQGAVENDIFDTGSYNDGAANHNLLSQNKMAWRTAFYENVGFPIPSAFVMLTTAAS